MGSVSAMSSIKRVLDDHGSELEAEVRAALPAPVRSLAPSITLENRTYEVAVELGFDGGERLSLSAYDIDELGDRFRCCEVGY
jgi:hypothetical protein